MHPVNVVGSSHGRRCARQGVWAVCAGLSYPLGWGRGALGMAEAVHTAPEPPYNLSRFARVRAPPPRKKYVETS